MQLLYVLLLAWARARAPIAVTDGPMADRSRPAALEKVGVQSQVSMHHAEKADGVATGVARSTSVDVMCPRCTPTSRTNDACEASQAGNEASPKPHVHKPDDVSSHKRLVDSHRGCGQCIFGANLAARCV